MSLRIPPLLSLIVTSLLTCSVLYGCDEAAPPASQESSMEVQQPANVSSERNRDLSFDDIPREAVISARQLHDLLATDKAPFVLDIRAAGLARDAFIEGSKNIPAGRQLDMRLDEIPRSATIALVADGTDRLAEARQTLIDAGYDPANLLVVENAMDDWVAAGYPTQSKPQMGC